MSLRLQRIKRTCQAPIRRWICWLSCFFLSVSLINQKSLEVFFVFFKASGKNNFTCVGVKWSPKKSKYYHFYGNFKFSVSHLWMYFYRQSRSSSKRVLKTALTIRFNILRQIVVDCLWNLVMGLCNNFD